LPNIYKTKEEIMQEARERADRIRANLPAQAGKRAEILIICQNGFRFRAVLREGSAYRTDAWIQDRSENITAFLGDVAHQMSIEESRPGLKAQLSITATADGYLAYINLVEEAKDDGGDSDTV